MELIRDEFEEDQREDDVLVLMSAAALTLRATLAGCLCRSAPIRRLDGATKFGRGFPEGIFKRFRFFLADSIADMV